MLLTITTTHRPATDLGYLLHKNPARVQAVELAFGRADVFYPEASEERCTAALLLEVDPVGLVRGRRPAGEGFSLAQYVNDRPYVASSLMSAALSRVLGSALNGHSRERPELVDAPLPLEARLPVLPARGGEDFLRRLFEPLGYEVVIEAEPDGASAAGLAEWDRHPYLALTLRGRLPLRALLSHLYVLIPVLDNDKHYWVSRDEIEKLLRHGEGWLTTHPMREAIVSRYLKRQRRLINEALARLTSEEEADADEAESEREQEEQAVERTIALNEQRLAAVIDEVRAAGAASVIDLGCGEGQLLRQLLGERTIERIVGLDVSVAALERAGERLKLERLPEAKRRQIELIHGSLMYRDRRLEGFDVATIIEVIEHLDPPRLAAFERVVFEFARPGRVILTTPNIEYNARFENLPAGQLRHRDHRFEWTRTEFEAWARAVAGRFGYSVEFKPVGPVDEQLGPPTQMGVFQP